MYHQNMKINEWIKYARNAIGMTQEQFGEALGRTKGNVSSWEKGAHEPSWSLMLQISDLTGQPLPIDFKYSPSAPAKKEDEFEINQFETGGSMGNGLILRDQPGVIQNWRVNAEWLQKNVRGASSTKNLCVVTGFGDSMQPLFNPGDPLLVDNSIIEFMGDSIYFFRIGNEGFVKRLQSIPGTGIRVISANKEYETWTITPDMDFEIFGRVLKVWKSEDF